MPYLGALYFRLERGEIRLLNQLTLLHLRLGDEGLGHALQAMIQNLRDGGRDDLRMLRGDALRLQPSDLPEPRTP